MAHGDVFVGKFNVKDRVWMELHNKRRAAGARAAIYEVLRLGQEKK